MKHIPVLLQPILDVLPQDLSGKTIIDATFGNGGYSREFLVRGANVIAFDRDPTVVPLTDDKFKLIRKPFSEIDMADVLADAIVFDFGVSSMQLDDGARGFSWRADAPLDMRMECDGLSAADAINKLTASELIQVMKDYGEEPKAKFIASEIIKSRPILTTFQFRDVISRASFDPKSVMRVFQAFRIYVNDELNEIKTALAKSVDMLHPGGYLATVSFHSLEDKIAKNFMRELTAIKGDPKMPTVDAAPFRQVLQVKPTDTEIAENPRARSAHLRIIQKI
jgi:16S rRNA (cytosine1402-N4)-methyltransferase